jgi:hypothetical protein
LGKQAKDLNMNSNWTQYGIELITAGLLPLVGCGGGGSTTSDETGLLSLAVSDGPIHDAKKVCITFDEIEFKHGSEAPFVVELDSAEKVNLLDFQGNNAAPLLFNEELPAGNYQWLRLGVDASLGSNGGAGDTNGDDCDGEGSYLVMNDETVHNLYVPSGAETGLKLVSGFTVPVNGSADFTAEFDLGKSITAPPGLQPDVILKPAIRLVNNVDAGTLTGQVSDELATVDACEASVYVFDDGVTPNGIEDGGDDPNDPVATAMLEEVDNAGIAEYHYTVGFLLAGDYEVAFTCDGAEFVPEEGKSATIEAQMLTTVDFP